MRRFAPTIRQLLLGLNALILGVPLAAVLFLPVFDAYLLRQTERTLIAESAWVGETWREHWLAARGLDPAQVSSFRPPALAEEAFLPWNAALDLGYQVLPPRDDPPTPDTPAPDPAKAAAGAALRPLLERAQVFNLSGVRVLDERGCALAASRGPVGGCYGDFEEVRGALAGRYTAVIRQRISDEPTPPLSSIRRRGLLRVFTAVPVFADGQVVAVVRMSRTAPSPLEALWTHRGKLAVFLVLLVVVTPAITYGLSHAISRPVRALAARADAVSRGEPFTPLPAGALTPLELQLLGDALAGMTRKLTERTRYILDFASQVSHELKTPISAIAGALELLRESGESMSEAQRERFLANMSGDAERMSRLVARLLELARIQTGPERSSPIELAPFLASIVARHSPQLRLDLAAQLPPLAMNPDHLESAVQNLIDNAVRHGGGQPIELRARPHGERVAIEVADRGGGIEAAHRDRIFERFYTTERDRGGTGLGLAIVQAVAEARGGRVELETGPDGSTFRLIL